MKSCILGLAALLLVTSPADARTGFTLEQCRQLYGHERKIPGRQIHPFCKTIAVEREEFPGHVDLQGLITAHLDTDGTWTSRVHSNERPITELDSQVVKSNRSTTDSQMSEVENPLVLSRRGTFLIIL
jgi:hypothetical protein